MYGLVDLGVGRGEMANGALTSLRMPERLRTRLRLQLHESSQPEKRGAQRQGRTRCCPPTPPPLQHRPAMPPPSPRTSAVGCGDRRRSSASPRERRLQRRKTQIRCCAGAGAAACAAACNTDVAAGGTVCHSAARAARGSGALSSSRRWPCRARRGCPTSTWSQTRP
jgi:hypothetical protein